MGPTCSGTGSFFPPIGHVSSAEGGRATLAIGRLKSIVSLLLFFPQNHSGFVWTLVLKRSELNGPRYQIWFCRGWLAG